MAAPARLRPRARRKAPFERRGRTAALSSARPGVALLGALCAVYALLATLPAAAGSNLVLATTGGSPAWLLGPFRGLGSPAADGPLAGPLFYAGLWLALVLYAAVVLRAADVSRRVAVGAIASLHVLFLLAPPLLSQDVFSYIAYARMGVLYDLNPYAHVPLEIASDPVSPFAGSIRASSVYGPAFTFLTYGLVPLGVAGAFWALKLLAALASLGVVLLVWRTAERMARDPVPAALVVGLNPLVLAHVVAAGHNEALMVLVTTAGVLAFASGRERLGAAVATAASGIKASAALVVPFLVAGARGAVGALVAVAVVATGLALLALAGFGADALDAVGLLSANQGQGSRFSLPYRAADLLGAVLAGDRLDYHTPVRIAFALAFVAAFVGLLARTRRGADPIAMAGWATLAALLASAWLVPWYVLWLLPLVAIAADRRLLAAALALTAWMLAIAVPL